MLAHFYIFDREDNTVAQKVDLGHTERDNHDPIYDITLTLKKKYLPKIAPCFQLVLSDVVSATRPSFAVPAALQDQYRADPIVNERTQNREYDKYEKDSNLQDHVNVSGAQRHRSYIFLHYENDWVDRDDTYQHHRRDQQNIHDGGPPLAIVKQFRRLF